MVTAVTSFGRSGLSDWLLQRVSGVILLAYFVFIGAVLAGGVDYPSWQATFEQTWVKIFSLLAILSLAAHAWIGMWTIGTDYLLPAHIGGGATVIRFVYQVGCLLIMFVYLILALRLIWQF